MIDLSRETLLTLKQVAERLNVTEKSVFAWMRPNRRNGRTLESCKIGGKRFTSVEALKRFSEQSVDEVRPEGRFGLPNGYQDAVKGLNRHGF